MLKNVENKYLKICLLSYRNDPFCGGQGVYIDNLSKGVFVREVITPGAGSTNHHFIIFNKKKIIAEHDLTY